MAVNRFQEVVRPQIGSQFVPLNLPMEEIGAQIQVKDQQQKQAIAAIQEDTEEAKELIGDIEGVGTVSTPDGGSYAIHTDVEASRIKAGIMKRIDALAERAVTTDLTDGLGDVGAEWANIEQEVKRQVAPGGDLWAIDQSTQQVKEVEKNMMENVDDINKNMASLLPVHETLAKITGGAMDTFKESPVNKIRAFSINDNIQRSFQGGDLGANYTGIGEPSDPAALLRTSMKSLKADKYMGSVWTPTQYGKLMREGWSGISEDKIGEAADYALSNDTALNQQLEADANYRVLTGDLKDNKKQEYIDKQKDQLKEQMVEEFSQSRDVSQTGSIPSGGGYGVTSDAINYEDEVKVRGFSFKGFDPSSIITRGHREIERRYGKAKNAVGYNATSVDASLSSPGAWALNLSDINIQGQDGSDNWRTIETIDAGTGPDDEENALDYIMDDGVMIYNMYYDKRTDEVVPPDKLNDPDWVSKNSNNIYRNTYAHGQAKVSYTIGGDGQEDGREESSYVTKQKYPINIDISDEQTRKHFEVQSRSFKAASKLAEEKARERDKSLGIGVSREQQSTGQEDREEEVEFNYDAID